MSGVSPASPLNARPPVPRMASDRSIHLLARGQKALCGHTESAWGPRGVGAVCPGCSAAAARPSRAAKAAPVCDDSGSEERGPGMRVDLRADGCEVEFRGVGMRLCLRYTSRRT